MLLTYSGCGNGGQYLQTPIEKSGFEKYTSNDDLVSFLNEARLLNPLITVEYFTVSGKKLPLVSISRNTGANEKLTLMLLGQLHGNEPSGMEGLLLLIRDFANGRHLNLLDSIDLLILPQCNPWGADLHKRTNEAGVDLNRDQLLISAKESMIIQDVFELKRPHMTVDFHEYYPYGKSWQSFGYRRNFDIQLGGPTNLNIDTTLINLFYNKALPYVKSAIGSKGFSFFEYTLGNFALGERLRRSTVDINDGRQSFAIAGTFSMIVEGMNGRDSLDRIRHRAESQYETALALLHVAYSNNHEIIAKVDTARNKLKYGSGPVSIRQEHFRGGHKLAYQLVEFSGNGDTIFTVEEYHSEIRSLLNVVSPKAYLIPKSDTFLSAWLARSNFVFTDWLQVEGVVKGYQIIEVNKSSDEELENYFPVVQKISNFPFSPFDYFLVPVNQVYRHKIITALEPQAMYGLVNYSAFNYLLDDKMFRILRVE